uniref:Mucosal addressin cell adhesion molecule 1 n=1 Tax=Sus scrofa TaxID=9823 RepID=A0ABB5UPP9_PIG
MEQGLALLLPLFLGLLQPGHGGRLEVEPPEPEVAVAVGESRQFACRLACADGQVASVQWRGLDTSLGSVKSGTGSSVLWVHNASLSAAGTRMCVGYCGKRSFHHTVNLLVFAFPDQLTVSPESLVPGRDREVACTAHNVSPARPDVFSMSLLLGDQELEGVQTLDRDVMEEPQEDEDPLFQVTERWLLPPLGIPAPPTLHCQVTMSLPGLNRSHRQSIPAPEVPTPSQGTAPPGPATQKSTRCQHWELWSCCVRRPAAQVWPCTGPRLPVGWQPTRQGRPGPRLGLPAGARCGLSATLRAGSSVAWTQGARWPTCTWSQKSAPCQHLQPYGRVAWCWGCFSWCSSSTACGNAAGPPADDQAYAPLGLRRHLDHKEEDSFHSVATRGH